MDKQPPTEPTAAFTWWNDCPAIKNRATGEVIVVFYRNARGWQECVAVLKSFGVQS